jgi:hypothetical protein
MEALTVKFVPISQTGKGFFFRRNLNLKAILTFVFLFAAIQLFAQSTAESEILTISNALFRWETEGNIDSLANLFDENFVIIGSSGVKRSGKEYLDNLKNGRPIHNSIVVEETSATIHGTTAIVTGKGIFVTTMNGMKSTSHLSYMEVFVIENKYWKLIALYASHLPD